MFSPTRVSDVLSCRSQWGYELGQASEMKVSIPLHGCEHFYLLTKPLQEPLSSATPGQALETKGNLHHLAVGRQGAQLLKNHLSWNMLQYLERSLDILKPKGLENVVARQQCVLYTPNAVWISVGHLWLSVTPKKKQWSQSGPQLMMSWFIRAEPDHRSGLFSLFLLLKLIVFSFLTQEWKK